MLAGFTGRISHDGIYHLGSGAIGHLQDDAGLGAGCACYAVCGGLRAGGFMKKLNKAKRAEFLKKLRTDPKKAIATISQYCDMPSLMDEQIDQVFGPWIMKKLKKMGAKRLSLPGNEPPGRAGKG